MTRDVIRNKEIMERTGKGKLPQPRRRTGFVNRTDPKYRLAPRSVTGRGKNELGSFDRPEVGDH